MSWAGKVLGGAFGFMLGGPLGAILGASLGHRFDVGLDGDFDGRLNMGDQQRVQMAFFTATFSVMGYIAKADGKVTASEIALAQQVMARLNLSQQLQDSAKSLFNQGREANFPLQEVLHQFRQECSRRTNLVQMFLEIQIQTAYADGVLDPAEDRILQDICRYLGVSLGDYARLKSQFQAGNNLDGKNLAAAYAVLGLKQGADMAQVKKSYRRLVSQYHPDKLVTKGLPEEMMVIAKQKTRDINKAYRTIKNQ